MSHVQCCRFLRSHIIIIIVSELFPTDEASSFCEVLMLYLYSANVKCAIKIDDSLTSVNQRTLVSRLALCCGVHFTMILCITLFTRRRL